MNKIFSRVLLTGFLLTSGILCAYTNLFEAIQTGKIDEVKKALEAGLSVYERGEEGITPLHLAAFSGDKEIVELLLKNGAPVNMPDNLGRRPLHMAAQQSNCDIIQILLEHGAHMILFHSIQKLHYL